MEIFSRSARCNFLKKWQCNDKEKPKSSSVPTHQLDNHSGASQGGLVISQVLWCSDLPKSPLTLAFIPGGPADVYGNARAVHFWHEVFICGVSFTFTNKSAVCLKADLDGTKKIKPVFYGKAKRSFLSFIHDDLWKELVKSQHCCYLKCCFHACFPSVPKSGGLQKLWTKLGFFHPGFAVWRRAIRAD